MLQEHTHTRTQSHTHTHTHTQKGGCSEIRAGWRLDVLTGQNNRFLFVYLPREWAPWIYVTAQSQRLALFFLSLSLPSQRSVRGPKGFQRNKCLFLSHFKLADSRLMLPFLPLLSKPSPFALYAIILPYPLAPNPISRCP